MNYSKVLLSLGVPMPYCNGEELPPKCGRGSSSAAGHQGSCEGWKTPRSTNAEEGWVKATSLATLYYPEFFLVLFLGVVLWSCGLPCVLCAVCCVRCGVVACSNETALFILGLEVYNCVIWW